MQQLDHAESKGLKPVDTIAVSRELIGFIEGSLLNECSETIITNYRSFGVDMNLVNRTKQIMSFWIHHSSATEKGLEIIYPIN